MDIFLGLGTTPNMDFLFWVGRCYEFPGWMRHVLDPQLSFGGASITTTPICSAAPNACRICCPRCPRAVLWSTPHVWKWCMRQICWRSWRFDQIFATSAMLRPRTLSRSRLRSMWSVSMCRDRIGHQEGIGKVCCRCKTLKDSESNMKPGKEQR